MPNLMPCAACSELVTSGICVCPHCGSKACRSRGVPKMASAALLGLSLVACGGDKEDTGATTTSGTVQAEYAAPATGTASNEAVGQHGAELAGALKHEDDGETGKTETANEASASTRD